MKTFTIVSNDAPKQVFETEATTMGELRAELDARGIDYEGKAIYEGLTRVEFTNANDDVVLPHDVNYKGATTSNLVFMLTAAKKKISSGADRKAVMQAIKENGLAEEVKERFGRNYTQVSTDNLLEVLNDYEECPAESKVETPNDLEQDGKGIPEEEVIKHLYLAMASLIDLTFALGLDDMLISILKNKNFIREAEAPNTEKQAETATEVYSDSEIAEMFN